MPNKKKGKEKTQKIRVDFRRNRNSRTRVNDWTQRFQDSTEVPEEADFQSSMEEQIPSEERISGKGDLVRKRTIVGTFRDVEKDSNERGDFEISPDSGSRALRPGRVLKVHGLNSLVEDESGNLYTCATRRILKTLSTVQRQIVVTGDRVFFRDAGLPDRREGIIERVEPRKGSLSRTSRKRKHILVTNVSQALIITSAAEPRLKPNLIDRFLVTCERSDIEPILCINKVDLVEPCELQPLIGVYSQMGYRVITTSVPNDLGIDRLRRLLKDQQSVLVGQSGVGKSSLLNKIDPRLNLRVGEVSWGNEKGKHTTTTAELFPLEFGGYVIDTPGVRQFMLWDIISEEVAGYYRDLRPFENRCRFPNCTHIHEEGCAVRRAVEDRLLDPRRYRGYLALRSGEMDKQEYD